MRKVIGIGETVLDIIFRNNQPIGAVPGGSTYNAMVSLGRAGVSAQFISETGNDRVGALIRSFLEENHVDSQYVCVYENSKSPLSLAFLNEQNEAEYLFYKDHPNDQLDFVMPEINSDDIVMFGSYYAVNPVIRPQVKGFLDYAKQNGAILYYDVNFRPSHKTEVVKLTPNIIENLELADIVRGSNEDFQVMYGIDSADKVYDAEISFYCKKFICTQGASPLVLHADGCLRKEYPVTLIEKTVSTIGAGDNFNAGLVFGMIKNGITRDSIDRGLTSEQWDNIIASGMAFSAECCKSLDNYISVEFGASVGK